MHFDWNSIFNNIVSNIIWISITGILLFSLSWAKKVLKPYIISFRTQIFAAFFLSYTAIISWLFLNAKPLLSFQLVAVPFLIIVMTAFFIWWAMRGFQTAQITAAFPTTSAGIEYSASLKLVNKSLDFMGIGAAKLTNDSEFEKALERCADLTAAGATVRLLLASPEHPIIAKTARANSVDEDEYKRNVTDSLQKIARIAEKKGGLIQVKHYNDDLVKGYPQFRLMFIDNEFCLFSWNVWDSTKGQNNPQLILRRGNAKRENRALYKSYHKYFTDLWELGTDVDLSQFLG